MKTRNVLFSHKHVLKRFLSTRNAILKKSSRILFFQLKFNVCLKWKQKLGPTPLHISMYILMFCVRIKPFTNKGQVTLNYSKEKSFQNNLGPKTMNKEQALKTARLCNLQQWIWLFSNRFKIYNYLKSIIMLVLFHDLGSRWLLQGPLRSTTH